MKKKILIYQTAFLGDLLLSIPLIKRIRNLHPHSEIFLVARVGCAQILLETGLVDKVFEIDKNMSHNYSDIQKQLLAYSFEAIYSPHYSIRTNFAVLKITSSMKIGFYNFWNLFVFNRRIKRNLNLPDSLRQLQLIADEDLEVKEGLKEYLKNADVNNLDLSNLAPNKNRQLIPSFSSMSLKNELQKHSLYSEVFKKYPKAVGAVFISPGSVWNTKRWTESGFRKICSHFENVILVGSPQERELCSRIADGQLNVSNFAGEPTLFELSILLTQAKLLICNDSGSMHLGSVSEAPTVAIFGPTTLNIGYQPWQDNAVVVENKQIACRPCGKHGHKKCPLQHHNCMNSISCDDVIGAADKLRAK